MAGEGSETSRSLKVGADLEAGHGERAFSCPSTQNNYMGRQDFLCLEIHL